MGSRPVASNWPVAKFLTKTYNVPDNQDMLSSYLCAVYPYSTLIHSAQVPYNTGLSPLSMGPHGSVWGRIGGTKGTKKLRRQTLEEMARGLLNMTIVS